MIICKGRRVPRIMPRITPNFWFDMESVEAAEFYCSVFPNSKIKATSYYTEDSPRPAGTVLTVDFELDGFVHRGFYNEALGRVEMHLEALRDQSVRIGDRTRRFAKGERIHTENSYKYRAPEFEALLRSAGFASVAHWASPDEGFFVFYAS